MGSVLVSVIISLKLLVSSTDAFVTRTNTNKNPTLHRLDPSNSRFKVPRLSTTIDSTVSEKLKKDYNLPLLSSIGSIVFLLPSDGSATKRPTQFGIHSPVQRPSVMHAVKHLCKKARYFSEEKVETAVVNIPSQVDADGSKNELIQTTLESANILLATGLSSEHDLEYAQAIFQKRLQQPRDERFAKCQFALDCDSSKEDLLPAMVGPYCSQTAKSNPSLLFPWTDASSGRRLYDQMQGLFNRWTSDDFAVALMLFLNRFSGSPVDWVKDSADATWEKGPVRNAQEFYGIGKCGRHDIVDWFLTVACCWN
jgi:hypothetical protein